jgi:hypothetical protein
MTKPSTQFLLQWKSDLQTLHTAAPDSVRAFGGLYAAAMAPGSLSFLRNESIAMAVGKGLSLDLRGSTAIGARSTP